LIKIIFILFYHLPSHQLPPPINHLIYHLSFFSVGPPYLASINDWFKIANDWTSFVPKVWWDGRWDGRWDGGWWNNFILYFLLTIFTTISSTMLKRCMRSILTCWRRCMLTQLLLLTTICHISELINIWSRMLEPVNFSYFNEFKLLSSHVPSHLPIHLIYHLTMYYLIQPSTIYHLIGGEGWEFIDNIEDKCSDSAILPPSSQSQSSHPLPTFLHYCQFYRAGQWAFQKRIVPTNIFRWRKKKKEKDISLTIYHLISVSFDNLPCHLW